MEQNTEQDIKKRVEVLLEEMFKIQTDSLSAEASLQEDLDLDSIDTIDLLSRLNEEYAIDLSPFDFEGCSTLGQFLERLEKCQQEQSS